MTTTELDRSGVAVATEALTKRYGPHTAVDGLTIQLPAGAITGFAGPNGAGKTTTMRMLLGLIKPTSGSAHVLGEPIEHPAQYLAQVGAMIEGPAFHPTMSARANLRVLTRLARLPEARIDDVLELVGLSERSDDHFRTFSQGMKQRLGLAAALLTNPRLVLLDEPTNGLDPDGIRQMRSLLEDLAARGTTVFVSSHLLAEVQAVCSHIVLIQHGQLRFQGSIGKLLAAQTAELVIAAERTNDNSRLADVFRGMGHEVSIEGDHLVVEVRHDLAAELNRASAAAGITLARIEHHTANLEDAFFAVTEQDQTP